MKSRLRELRGKMALEEFTQHCGLPSKSSLDRWEKGESEPKVSDLTKIGRACRVSVDWLLGLTEDRAAPARHAGQENIPAAPPGEQPCPRCTEKDEVIKNLSKALAQGRPHAAPASGACGGGLNTAPKQRNRRAGA